MSCAHSELMQNAGCAGCEADLGDALDLANREALSLRARVNELGHDWAPERETSEAKCAHTRITDEGNCEGCGRLIMTASKPQPPTWFEDLITAAIRLTEACENGDILGPACQRVVDAVHSVPRPWVDWGVGKERVSELQTALADVLDAWRRDAKDGAGMSETGAIMFNRSRSVLHQEESTETFSPLAQRSNEAMIVEPEVDRLVHQAHRLDAASSLCGTYGPGDGLSALTAQVTCPACASARRSDEALSVTANPNRLRCEGCHRIDGYLVWGQQGAWCSSCAPREYPALRPALDKAPYSEPPPKCRACCNGHYNECVAAALGADSDYPTAVQKLLRAANAVREDAKFLPSSTSELSQVQTRLIRGLDWAIKAMETEVES